MSLELLANASFSLEEENAFEKTADKLFKCPSPDCNREFSSKRNLVDHFRGHHQGAKPHVCEHPGCGKSFLRPAHLLIHNRIHTGEKPFVCPFEGCEKRWNQKSALKQHMRSHTGEKPFVCTVEACTKSFSTSSSCKRHIATHSKYQDSKDTSPSQKRKVCSILSHSDSSSSDDDHDHDRPYKKLSTGTTPIAMPKLGNFGQVTDELARKMTLNFILN